MKPLRLFSTLALSAVIALCAATAWKLRTAENAAPANRAWGNVETRQTSLAFEASGRIAALHKEEGESVQAGELLGQLDDEALRIGRRQAAAELKRLQAQAALAHEGTRQEDIDAARANEAAARAQLEYASATLKRQQDLVPAGAASRQMLDDARRAEHAARESLTAAAAQRAAAEKGPRRKLPLPMPRQKPQLRRLQPLTTKSIGERSSRHLQPASFELVLRNPATWPVPREPSTSFPLLTPNGSALISLNVSSAS